LPYRHFFSEVPTSCLAQSLHCASLSAFFLPEEAGFFFAAAFFFLGGAFFFLGDLERDRLRTGSSSEEESPSSSAQGWRREGDWRRLRGRVVGRAPRRIRRRPVRVLFYRCEQVYPNRA